MDPLAEKYYSISPYAYVANNPINAVDLEGDSITSQHVEGFFKGVASTGTGLGAIIGQVSSWVGTYNIAKGLINSDNITETMRDQGKAIIADVKNNPETQGEIVGTAVTAVASIGVGSTASAGRSGMSVAAKGSTMIEIKPVSLRKVGTTLESIDDVMANPQLLKGTSPLQVEGIIVNTPGWKVGGLGKGSQRGNGFVLRKYNSKGNPTGSQLRWHPGGGHHGSDSYWRVIGPNGDLGGIIK